MNKTKISLLLMLAGAAAFAAGLWFYSTMESPGVFEYAVAALVVIMVVTGVVVGLKRIESEKKGLAVEDELSRRIRQKAAANAFSFSFYLWTMIAVFTVDSKIRIEIPIGIGILGMGLLFVGYWIYYSKTGIKDENTH